MRDQEIPVKRNFVKVVVQVEDCNDHPPAFLSPRYEASVSNRAPAGSEVVRVKALDKDTGSNAEIRYALYTGEHNKSDVVFPSEGGRPTSEWFPPTSCITGGAWRRERGWLGRDIII